MKNFILTTLTCTLICLAIPVNQVHSQPEGGYKPTVKSAPKPASLVADSTGSGFIVIDSAGYEQGTYVLQLDLRDDGWALKTLTAVNLNGQPARPLPKDPDDPRPPVNPDPDPKPGPVVPDNETLAEIQSEFEAIDELELFEQQLTLMREALSLQENMADITAMHAWVQRGFEVAIRKHADLWVPWTSWYNAGAEDAQSSEDYRTWVELAKESLQ